MGHGASKGNSHGRSRSAVFSFRSSFGDSRALESSSVLHPKGRGGGIEDIRDRYQIQHVIGAGSFAQVRQATLLQDPQVVRAVKIIEQVDSEGTSMKELFYREVQIHREVQHPNIVQFWEAYMDVHFLYLVGDLCRGGEVFSMIVERRFFTESDAALIAMQALKALDYIHANGIMHRDIKAENFLFTDKSRMAVVRLIDFGMSVKFERGQVFDEICGSPHHLAPELIGQMYTRTVDMWAFGVFLYLMLYGRYPFDGNKCKDIMLKILHSRVRFEVKSSPQPSNSAVHLLKYCLEKNTRKRLSAREVLRDPWIVNVGINSWLDTSTCRSTSLTDTVKAAEEVLNESRSKISLEVQPQQRERVPQELEADFKNALHSGCQLDELDSTIQAGAESQTKGCRQCGRRNWQESMQKERCGIQDQKEEEQLSKSRYRGLDSFRKL